MASACLLRPLLLIAALCLVACSGNTETETGASSSSAASSSSSGAAFNGMYKGVNLAGAEFGEGSYPGVYKKDYIYPTQDEVDYFKSKGMNTLRMPFSWERLQPELNRAFNATEFGRFDSFVTGATAKDMHVILDPHNYARWNNMVIGAGVPNSAFADLWRRLAEQYKDNARVIFGLMNEPRDMPTEQWVAAANAATVAIRNTGATNLILVPGNAWSGAHSWFEDWYGTANAIAILAYHDPGNNYAIEAHQYFDKGYAGVMAACVTSDGGQLLTKFTAWLAANNNRGFLGEFAGADNPTCRQAVEGALQHLEDNKKYWIGWTWWAAGPWWADYMFSIEPQDGDKPQMSWLTPFL